MSEYAEWQQRVITEKDELDEKLEKLAAYLVLDPDELDAEGTAVLERQYRHMNLYSMTLAERIGKF